MSNIQKIEDGIRGLLKKHEVSNAEFIYLLEFLKADVINNALIAPKALPVPVFEAKLINKPGHSPILKGETNGRNIR